MFTGNRIDPLVVHTWLADLDRTSTGHHLTRLVVPVADTRSTIVLIHILGVGFDVCRDLGMQRSDQHPPGTFFNDLV